MSGELGATVSVVVAVRNGERFIAEALGSIAAQTLAPDEIVVVDGGSTDRTAAIAGATPGVRVVAQVGRGIADAYNTGVAETRGDLIAFLSHDDRWTPDKLAVQVGRMLEAPHLDFTVARARFFAESGCALPPGFRPGLLVGDHEARIMETLCARRRCFERVGGFDRALTISEDVDWFARASDAGLAMEIIQRVLLDKRVHDANASLAPENANRDLLRSLRRSIERKRQGATPAEGAALDVSVVIPVRDGAAYLAAAIESVLAQSRKPREVIVVDDGSRDDSAKIALGFGAPVRCVRQEAAGPAAARNRGEAEAQGAWLAFLDADDLWTPDKLARQWERFGAEPELDVVFGAVEQFASPDLAAADLASVRVPEGTMPALAAGGMLVRREAWRRVGPLDAGLLMGDFIDWYARAQEAGLRMAVVDATVLRRRVHRGNLGRREVAARSDYARVAKAALDRRRAAAKKSAPS